MRSLLLFMFTLLLAACGTVEELPAGDLSFSLEEADLNACSDAAIALEGTDQTLFISAPTNLSDASDGTIRTFEVGQDDIVVELQRLVLGDELGDYILPCDDVMRVGGEIQTLATGTAGTITIERLPTTEEQAGFGGLGYYARVTLAGVTLSNGEESITLPDTTFEDVYLGWLPG